MVEYVQLFSKGRLNDPAGSLAGFLRKASQATARLQSWDADDLNTPVDDVVEQLVRWVRSNAPDLRVDDAFMLPATEVDQQYRVGANGAPDVTGSFSWCHARA